jgi:hydroxyacylglutathione hydrolase
MPLIPLEDNYADIIAKALRGHQLDETELVRRAEITTEDLAALKAGGLRPNLAVLRRCARHLHLGPDALEAIATRRWYPEAPVFKRGFAMFNTRHEDMTVNNYLLWDPRSHEAVIVDTGTEIEALLDCVRTERLRVKFILLTHTHDDHMAALAPLVAGTRAEVWSSVREPVAHPGARTFADLAYFHAGALQIKCLPTWGHSPGMTSFFVQGLSYPLVCSGDALFAGSVGGTPTHFKAQLTHNRDHLLSLPRDTVVAPGHGPLTTMAEEKRHNPFITRK